MKQISEREALGKIQKWQQAGMSISRRVFSAVQAAEDLFLVRLEDRTSFLSLIWQDIPDTRLLTPFCEPRTLQHVAQRMLDQSWTFERLASDLGKPSEEHKPQWFKQCCPICSHFDFDRFGWVIVVPANDHERQCSPTGSLYIFDGVHKTLVLSNLLLSNVIKYQPIDALLLLPRPKSD